MPYTLPPISITQNQTVPINLPGSLGSITYVKLVNASPYLVALNNLLGGSDYLQPGEANVWPVPGLTTSIQATALPFVSSAVSSNAPTSVIVVTWYLEGEQPEGIYPVNFGMLTFNGGNIGVASQLVNDGNTAGTRIVEATPGTEPQSYIIVSNDGTVNVFYKSPTLGIVQAFISGLTPDAQYGVGFQVSNGLAVFGASMLDGAAGQPIRTDGAGNISFVGNINSTGNISAAAPVILKTGHQETGAAGFEFTAAAASAEGAYMPNFKTVMSHTPTSITLTVSFSSNFKGLGADSINTYGFRFVMQSVAAGLCQWIGSYTTVGNCLLAYDATARTFDHHCDHCGAVHRGVALLALASQPGPAPQRSGLSYTCPDCGTSEHFNCALSAEDEADTSPQGTGAYATTRGGQATLIRRLMTALGMEVAP